MKLDLKALASTFKKLGTQYPFLKLAYLHGSQALEKPTPLSDVDVALVVDPKKAPKSNWDFEIEMETAMENQFQGCEFDVRVMNEAPIDFQGKVITEGKLLYSANNIFRADFEEKTRKHYFDFLPFIETYCRERLQTVQEEGLTHGG